MKLSNASIWWAKLIVSSQLKSDDLPSNHYGWKEVSGFAKKIFNIQQKNLIDFVKQHSFKCKTVVEVGASSDMFLRHVDADVKVGVNVLDECIEQLNRQGIIGVKSHDEHIPVGDKTSDLTICFETLEHVHNPILFLNELYRITKRRLLVSIPLVKETTVKEKIDCKENHVFEFSRNDFRKLLSYTDLEISEYRELVNYKSIYDPFTNWCIRKLRKQYFQSIQAYVLRGKGGKL